MDDPAGFVALAADGTRIHFLDWGGSGAPGVVLVHGLSTNAWTWAPVARLLAADRRTIAVDLRGHGLSDAPTGQYAPDDFVEDVVAAAEGSGALGDDGVVVAGHGFGAIVAAWTAAALGERCVRLVLVDGGWEDVATTSGMDVDELLRTLEEPPEVMSSIGAWLADRRDFDPATWDADQERAARSAVVETPAGRLVPATRPHALRACVEAMLAYSPAVTLNAVRVPIVGLAATSPDPAPDVPSFDLARVAAAGHNLMRYRRNDVAAAILGR